MAKVYYDQDADLAGLADRKIAVLGYGSQGHAHALNLRDSGCQVRIGLEAERKSALAARRDGFVVMELTEASAWADLVVILVPDEAQPGVYNKHIQPVLDDRKILLFAHGFSIHFGFIVPPPRVGVALVAPKSPGHMLRREFAAGRGVPGLLALHRDAPENCLETAKAYAKAIGLTRAGLIETSFQEETETDLFGEQAVLCGGLTSLMRLGFETLLEAGYQPELAYFECIHEMKLIVDLIYEGGMGWMRHSVSNTAEYGDYITQEKMNTTAVRESMRGVLAAIRSGEFAREWMADQQRAGAEFRALRELHRSHRLEEVGANLRAMMPWLNGQKEASHEK